MLFTYTEFTTRNIGFVTQNEQQILQQLKVFIPGMGGMGGIAISCLARMGVENFIISDFDHFEISNLNRQIFASVNNIGKNKSEEAKNALKAINPNIQIEVISKNWVNVLDDILPKIDLVINGCDDVKSTIQLIRKCQEKKISVIDAFASSLPNVYVIQPEDKRPEELLNFPTILVPYNDITDEMLMQCISKEIEYVISKTSSGDYFDTDIANEVLSGKRKRPSFAPMVWTTGCLMAYEASKIALNKPGIASNRGVFLNLWNYQVEKL